MKKNYFAHLLIINGATANVKITIIMLLLFCSRKSWAINTVVCRWLSSKV